MNVYKECYTAIILILCVATQANGYETKTHEKITNEAFLTALTTKDFISAIGYSSNYALKDAFTSKTAIEWAKEGSVKEDETFASDVGGENFRYVHHFYDPVSKRGLDFNLAIAGHGYYHVIGNKAPDWALEDSGTFSKQFYSIQHAKEYYFAGLTAGTKDAREANLAKTFKTLGQVLHVLQDMAQPQHTRNDPHGGDIAGTSLGPPMFGIKSQYELYVNNPTRINTFNYTAAYPVSFDLYRKFYASDDGKGMANFSNRNFVTELTNFKCTLADCQGATGGGYASPALDIGKKMDIPVNQLPGIVTTLTGNVTFFGNDITDFYSGQNISNDYMTTYSIFDRDLKNKNKTPAFTLNRFNYAAMAQILLPRAVGYSAGLLNYFFRGTLEITQPDRCLYGLIDGSVLPQQFTQIKAKVRNTTPNETIGNGIIQAVARYKIIEDYQPDLSTYPTTSAGSEPDFSYSVSEPKTLTADDIIAINSTTPKEFTFTFANSPIPAGITDLYLHVVFKGTLGNETNIAVAVGNKDLSEPMHHVYWNATDRFYLDRILRTADEIENDPQLLSRVDHNNDGTSDEPIEPYDVKTEIAFCPTAGQPISYQVIYDPLPPGSFGRVITITEVSQTEFPLIIHRVSIDPPVDKTSSFTTSGIVSQGDEYTQVYTFRGIAMHAGSAYANYYPDATNIFTIDWPPPINSSPVPIKP